MGIPMLLFLSLVISSRERLNYVQAKPSSQLEATIILCNFKEIQSLKWYRRHAIYFNDLF